MENLKSMEVHLCKWLSIDPDHIIEQCEEILSAKQDRMLRKQDVPLEKITLLLKLIIDDGESKCQKFYDILLKQQAHYPDMQLFFNKKGSPRQTVSADAGSIASARQLTGIKAKNLKLSVKVNGIPGVQSVQHGLPAGRPLAQCNALNNSVACADTLTDVDVGGDIDFSVEVNTLPPAQMVYPAAVPHPETTVASTQVDKQDFFIKNRGKLVRNVKNGESIVDDLISRGFHAELAANVSAENTAMGRMREILDSVSSKALAEVLFNALLEHQNDVMMELLG